ncbi:MAG: T9SS type A sorting domain-containing protein, partial [Cytophagaceae bacterium]
SVVPTATFGSLSVNNPAGSTVNFLGQLSTTAPLPVVLTAFTATPAAGGRAIHLAWATASEVNNARFEAERSFDGVYFSTLRTVAAAGSSAAAHTYALTDADLPATARSLYYRLRQVDTDGTASYSPVRVVAIGLASPLVLFPNPAGATTTLAGAGPGAVVRVLDALGQVVATATTDATGTATLALPATLPGGVYLVRAGTQVARLAVP